MGKRTQRSKNNRQPKKRYTITTEDIIKQIEKGGFLTKKMIEILNEESLIAFIKDRIPSPILEQAKCSKKDVVGDIYRLIVGVDNYVHMRERTIGNLAGVVGHVWAIKYFRRKGYKVENEVPLYDNSTGQKLTDTDIILTDLKGRQTFIELKTAFKIGVDGDMIPQIDIDKKYVDYLKPGDIIPRSKMQIVRKETMSEVTISTGNGAIRQLKANRTYISSIHDGVDRKVALCVFNGVEIYPEAYKKIGEQGEVIKLPLNIYKLYKYCFDLVANLVYDGRNLTNPPRGEKRKKFEERYGINRIDLDL